MFIKGNTMQLLSEDKKKIKEALKGNAITIVIDETGERKKGKGGPRKAWHQGAGWRA